MLKFGEALEAMKNMRCVARKGWNGKGMHVFLEECFTSLINLGDRELKRTYEPVFCIWTGTTTQPGWLPSQADLLADDWYIIEN